MTTTAGSQMHELIVETKAQELIKLMELTAPELRSAVTVQEANEALVDALTFLESDHTDGLTMEIVARAKALVMRRTALN